MIGVFFFNAFSSSVNNCTEYYSVSNNSVVIRREINESDLFCVRFDKPYGTISMISVDSVYACMYYDERTYCSSLNSQEMGLSFGNYTGYASFRAIKRTNIVLAATVFQESCEVRIFSNKNKGKLTAFQYPGKKTCFFLGLPDTNTFGFYADALGIGIVCSYSLHPYLPQKEFFPSISAEQSVPENLISFVEYSCNQARSGSTVQVSYLGSYKQQRTFERVINSYPAYYSEDPEESDIFLNVVIIVAVLLIGVFLLSILCAPCCGKKYQDVLFIFCPCLRQNKKDEKSTEYSY